MEPGHEPVVDDLGLLRDYRDIARCYATGSSSVLPPEEYAEIPWEKFENNDPSLMPQLLTKIAQACWPTSGTAPTGTERWNDMDWNNTAASCMLSPRGLHHSQECFGQVGLYNVMFNRDDMIHSAVNLQGCGLPIELKKAIGAEIFGDESAVDPDKNYTPMNAYKANFAHGHRHRRAARLAHAVQLGVAHGHVPHSLP